MILVTGGTGLVGSHLLLELLRHTSTLPIRATTRTLNKIAQFENIASFYSDIEPSKLNRIEWVKADMSDADTLRAVMEDVTQVYHCAATVSFDPRRTDEIRSINIEGTAELVNLAIAQKVSKFCFVSSIAAIGGSNTSGERNEEIATIPRG